MEVTAYVTMLETKLKSNPRDYGGSAMQQESCKALDLT